MFLITCANLHMSNGNNEADVLNGSPFALSFINLFDTNSGLSLHHRHGTTVISETHLSPVSNDVKIRIIIVCRGRNAEYV